MKIIQNIGMTVFIAASALLVILLFFNSYTLTTESLSDAISDKQERQQISEALAPMINMPYAYNHSFIQQINTHLNEANELIKRRYEITDEEVRQVASLYPEKNIIYNNDVISGAFGQEDTDLYKAQKLKEYTSWMNDRQFATREELQDQLSSSQGNINSAIIRDKGYGDDKIKALKLAVTRQSSHGPLAQNPALWLLLTIGLGIVGALMYILPKLKKLPGIKNDDIFHSANSGRGWIAYSIGTVLIAFYIILYWFPEYMTSWMILVDPVSKALNGNAASQWFFYGFLYTLAIAVMGLRMIIKYRHSQYQIIRTCSVIFFQTAFAFLIPEILIRLNRPSMDLKNIWPLNYTFFFDYNIEHLTHSGRLGMAMLVWGIILIIVAVPVITYFFGKRWYCSWVCGCGGLAETLGDPYRQLSDKSVTAWKVERWMIHGVLVFAVLMTAGVLYTYFTGSSELLGINTYDLRSTYGFLIGAAFAGVVGVGFYPLMGNRVWCRFGCPLAAYLGIIQRFKSRFRITTNGGQCISCGNCSTYCEMGIDVRWYAQRGQNIVRASCVGCGVCSSVCPRGVLKLENNDSDRFAEPLLIGNDGVKIKA